MEWRERLQQLRGELNELGYTTLQLEQIIRETVGNVPANLLTEEQSDYLTRVFEEYLQFGTKCLIAMQLGKCRTPYL